LDPDNLFYYMNSTDDNFAQILMKGFGNGACFKSFLDSYSGISAFTCTQASAQSYDTAAADWS